MDAPAFVPERGEIWHADGNGGFSVLRFTNGVWPFEAAATPADEPTPAPEVVDILPATGSPIRLALTGAVLLGVVLVVRLTSWPSQRSTRQPARRSARSTP